MKYRSNPKRWLVGDFETTVYDGQKDTLVWASALVEFNSETLFEIDPVVLHSIGETWSFLLSLESDLIVYYHNLKFDGSFWLSFFMTELGKDIALDAIGHIKNKKSLSEGELTYSISDMGAWYYIAIKVNGHLIEFRDSLKLIPLSVANIGNSFGTLHKKLSMEYKGYRYPGCEITDEEKRYIINDVLVVKEALEIFFNEGHQKLTIGSCCMSEFKAGYDKEKYKQLFPDLTKINCPVGGFKSADEYIRKSYRGGWCYLVKGKEKKVFHHGLTADVNSLYPSMMSSESGNFYPVGKPTFWDGDTIPEEAKEGFYFVRISCQFMLKDGFLPFMQIKGNPLYKSTEMLETSDIFYEGKYFNWYYDSHGLPTMANVTLTLTQTDFELFLKHYDVDYTILDGCYFKKEIGLFDKYIEKYKQIKLTSKGGRKQIAKLFLNNLYGKMAANSININKIAILAPDGSLKWRLIEDKAKQAGFIAIGTAITSYARCFTINAAQANFHGVNAPGFIYADTDSIHCDLQPGDVNGVPVHPKDFCHWKLETYWDDGYFVRAKTYIEHVTHENGEEVAPYFNIKCAGLPKRSKLALTASFGDKEALSQMGELSAAEAEFVGVRRTYTDFKEGIKIPSKLRAVQIKGGTLLVDCDYIMR